MQIFKNNNRFCAGKYRIIVICCALLTATSVMPQDDAHTWSSLLQQCGHHIDNIGRTTGSVFLQTLQGVDTAVSQIPKSILVGGVFIGIHYAVQLKGGWSGLVTPNWLSRLMGNDKNRTPKVGDLYQLRNDMKEELQSVVQQTQQQAYTDGYNQACQDMSPIVRQVVQEEFAKNVPHMTTKIDDVYNSLRDRIYRIDAKLDNYQEQVRNDISYHGVETRSRIAETQTQNADLYNNIEGRIRNIKDNHLYEIQEHQKDMYKRLFESEGNLEQRMQNIEHDVSCILSSQDRRSQAMICGLQHATNQISGAAVDGSGTAADDSYRGNGNTYNVFFNQNVVYPSSVDTKLFQQYMPHGRNIPQPLHNSFPRMPQVQRTVQPLSNHFSRTNSPNSRMLPLLKRFMPQGHSK